MFVETVTDIATETTALEEATVKIRTCRGVDVEDCKANDEAKCCLLVLAS